MSRMGFGVGERERGAPRPTKDEPTLDAEVRAQALHVLDQVPRRVIHETRVGPALAAAALVEEDDSVAFWVEEAPHLGVSAAPLAPMDKLPGLAFRNTRFFVVDLMQIRDPQEPGAI